MSTERLQRIETYSQEYIDTNQIAGAVTLVARQGKVVRYEAQGWRYKEEDAPMTRDTIFRLASMTKPIRDALQPVPYLGWPAVALVVGIGVAAARGWLRPLGSDAHLTESNGPVNAPWP